MNILRDSQIMCDTGSVFDNSAASKDKVTKAGEAFIIHVYGAYKTQSLDKQSLLCIQEGHGRDVSEM